MAEGPLPRRLFNGQVDLPDESLIVGEDRLVLGHLLDLPVQALDRIRRINQGLDLRRILEKGDDLVPVRSPRGGDVRVALVLLFRELFQGGSPLFLRGSLVDPPQVFCYRLALLPGHIAQRVPDLVDDARLELGPGEDGLDGLGDPLEVVDREDQNIFDAAVL